MSDKDNLSMGNLLDFAMGLSMANLFSRAMNNAFETSFAQQQDMQSSYQTKYIYAVVNGAQSGPYSIGEIVDMIKSRTITPDTYIWKAGMPEWLAAKDITDISPNFEVCPPPIP